MQHKRLKSLRKQVGMTQNQLADAMGYSLNHYHLIEQGIRAMPEGFFQRAVKKMCDHIKYVESILLTELNAS